MGEIIDVPVAHVKETTKVVKLTPRVVLVPQIMEEMTEVIKRMSHKQVQECISEETVDIPVPQVREGTNEVMKRTRCEQAWNHMTERVSGYTVEQMMDALVPMDVPKTCRDRSLWTRKFRGRSAEACGN